MKKGSADGRLLIWKISSQLIIEKPFFGYGIEKFQAHYMEKQAEYFRGNLQSKEAFVADDIIYPFNEFIKAVTELGFIGISIIFLIISAIFNDGKSRKSKEDKNSLLPGIRAGMLSFIAFSFFSYPLEILPIELSLVVFIATYSRVNIYQQLDIRLSVYCHRQRQKLVKIILPIIITTLIIASFAPLKKLYLAYYHWDKGYNLYRMNAYNDCNESFKEAFPVLHNNGEFLIMYGKSLSMAGKYKSAIKVLEKAKNYQQNTILYNALGDSYKYQKKYTYAEKSYLQAHFMIPSRFYSKYLLVKMYDETGQSAKAKEHAKELLEKEVKVPSQAVEEIQMEMRPILGL